ncbi:MAG: hypothetical protein WBQ14_08880 [Gaiellaceae bacterium]
MAIARNLGGSGVSAMLGSSRRDSRARFRLEGDELVLVERPAGTFRFWTSRLIARLETLFSPPKSRP